MMRFIDLGKQIGLDEKWPHEFAFFNTVSSQFLQYGGMQVWESWKHFEKWFDEGEELKQRLKRLCPDWVFNPKTKP